MAWATASPATVRYRLSLRVRIVVAFVVTGAVLGPLLAAALLWATYEWEERAVARLASERLTQVMARPEEFGLRELAQVPGVRVLSNFGTALFPSEMLRLPDGIHEYETAGGDAWFIALGSGPTGRYAVVEDITALEKRERLTAVVVAGGTALAMYLALWIGMYLSRRLLAPLVQLAERVSEASPAGPRQPLAPDFAADEVGTLAAALDRHASRMHEALRREREFSADVSHELRTPLTVIHNAAELIGDDGGASERTRRAAQRIRAAAEHMNETVMVLLTLVREERPASPDERVCVAECVETLLRERLGPAAAGAPEMHWRLRARPEVQAPRAVVDAIAANLIRNAQQHSMGQHVQISLEQDRLVVKDDGVGIQAEQRPPSAGSGLGLSLVQRLCARFGWSLHIDSRPGEGTQVEWRFSAA
jgi:signal transduction histidine kinase